MKTSDLYNSLTTLLWKGLDNMKLSHEGGNFSSTREPDQEEVKKSEHV